MTTETTTILLKRGTASKAAVYAGPPGEVVVDAGLWTLRVQDGMTPGGIPLAAAAHAHNFSELTGHPTTLAGYGITDGGMLLGDIVPAAPGVAAPGVAVTASRADHVHPAATSVAGNAETATALQTPRSINGTAFSGASDITTSKWGAARSISVTGDVTGSVTSVDGAADVSLVLTVQGTGVQPGEYSTVIVDAKGRVTSGRAASSGGMSALIYAITFG